jgi:hypothetical protein
MGGTAGRRRFQLVLVKPSRYDDDGYVVQWWRSVMPSNSLACLYGIARDAADRRVLGPDVDIDIEAIDEINTAVRTDAIVARISAAGGFGMVGLVGVQSNQFPRAVDIARPLRAAGVPVVIGGFHVSGCLAMLKETPPDIQEALDLGISLFAGEAEGRLDRVLQDAAAGTLPPVYDHLADLPSVVDVPTPALPPAVLARTLNQHSSFDAGRGCPYQCSFCTIINVQGRQSRRRSPDDVERLIRQSLASGSGRFFITDDNFARNKDWEPILDRIIAMREAEGLNLRFSIQVDALAYKIPGFVEKAARAGVRQVFIGLENINPANLLAAKKRQNKITEYREMLLAWKRAKVVTYAGYILGFPNDTPESIRADIEIIKAELPLDIIGFYFLTPLPGSEDHKILAEKGEWMDPDMNKYDLEHCVTGHATMSREAWIGAYRDAWTSYYTPAHIETIMRRGAATGTVLARLVTMLFVYAEVMAVENVHPLQGGLLRIKRRRDRRPNLPIEPAWRFYPKFAAETVWKQAVLAKRLAALLLLYARIRRDPNRRAYLDTALGTDAGEDGLALLTHTQAARDAVAHSRKLAALGGC